MKLAGYHRLPAARKQAHSLDRMREPAVTCPRCDTQVMPADLVAHVEQRCAGPREPGKGSIWVGWREALALGPSRGTLSYWVKRGYVRVRGDVQERKYLLRDLAVRVARMGARRR